MRSFLARFETDRDAVERRLEAERAKHGASAKPPTDSKGILDELRALVLGMEARTAEASYFLPPYDARACASTTDRLKADLAAAADALAPRKKFSFKSKREKKPLSSREEASLSLAKPPGKETRASSSSSREKEKDEKHTAEKNDAEKDALLARVAAMSAAADASGFRDATGTTFAFRDDDDDDRGDAPDLILERLTDCVVFILGTTRALRCHDLTRTRVYGGPVAGSAHLQNLENCHVEIAARQVRVHDARRTSFYVRTKSRPIIEHSSELTFAPFAFAYDGADQNLAAAGLDVETDAWRDVDDFGWIKNRQSPNWSVAPEGERATPPPPPPP